MPVPADDPFLPKRGLEILRCTEQRFSPTCYNNQSEHSQGNRISKYSEEFGKEEVVPTGAFEFAAQGSLWIPLSGSG